MRACLYMVALTALSWSAAALNAAEKTETIEGKLIVHPGQATTLETDTHKVIALDGDQPTRKVLNDDRLNGFDVHATGHFTAPGKFLIDPQHKRALLVHQHDKLKMITYWCEVCGIRAYTPGPCVCCQADTALDLRDPDDIH